VGGGMGKVVGVSEGESLDWDHVQVGDRWGEKRIWGEFCHVGTALWQLGVVRFGSEAQVAQRDLGCRF
jgi:hypothetical protein